MLIDLEKIKEIEEKYIKGQKILRSEKIYFENITYVRRSGIKYSMNCDELSEYIKCSNSVEYFAEKYCNIILRKFQKDYSKIYSENRFTIWMCSRQCGSSVIQTILMLHSMLFNQNFNIGILCNKLKTSEEYIKKIKNFYIRIPFFLKVGVIYYNKSNIKFENGSQISFFDIDNVLDYDNIIISEFAYIKKIDFLFSKIYSAVNNKNKTKLNIISTPNGYNLFVKIFQYAESNFNVFKALKTYWWEVSNRDENWKNDQIKFCGLKIFEKDYELRY